MEPWLTISMACSTWRGVALVLEVGLCSSAYDRQNDLVILLRAHHDQPQIRAQAANGAEQGGSELVAMQTDQRQGEFLIGEEIRQIEGHEFDPRVLLK